MTKKALLTIAFAVAHFVCLSQTPNAVSMVLEPFPEDEWYIHIRGNYGHQNYETNTFVRDSVELRGSAFLGMVGDEIAERGIAWGYTWAGSDYDIEVITDLGTSRKYHMSFTLISETFGGFGPDDEWAKFARSFKAYAVVKGQPKGFRFYESQKTPPYKNIMFKEVMYEDPGEPPKLRMVETVFVPTGIADTEYEDFDWEEYFNSNDPTIIPPDSPPTELEGEGYEGYITPHTVTNISTEISYDDGATWKSWRDGGIGSEVIPPERLAQNPHPIIKVTAYHRMRRYVKYYTYKKGFSDAPGGPYEPITMEELQEQGNGKKLEDTADSLKSVEDGGTEDTTDHVKTIADESIAETTGERSK